MAWGNFFFFFSRICISQTWWESNGIWLHRWESSRLPERNQAATRNCHSIKWGPVSFISNPKSRLSTGGPPYFSFWALIRCQQPSKSLLDPDRFIELYYGHWTGSQPRFPMRLLKKHLKQTRTMAAQAGHKYQLSINLTAYHLLHEWTSSIGLAKFED